MTNSKIIATIQQFCKVNEVTPEDLININSKTKGGIMAELRKSLTRKLIDSGCSFKQVAEVFGSRVQLARYYYYAPPINNKALEIEKLQRKLLIYQEKLNELTPWLIKNTLSMEYNTIVGDKIHYQNKVIHIKAKINNLKNGLPALGLPDPEGETKWNGKKNGDPIK